MAMDVVHILKKARLDLRGLRVHLSGERQADHPRRLVRAELGFRVEGDVPPDRVERAIALSRERYCTVWHSLRPDIELATRYEIARRA
jgi:putative redox protein